MTEIEITPTPAHIPWNKGKLVGQKPPLKLRERCIALLGGDSQAYGTHALRRTKATLIYRRAKNLRATQLLLRHRKLQSTVRDLGIEVDDALEAARRHQDAGWRDRCPRPGTSLARRQQGLSSAASRRRQPGSVLVVPSMPEAQR